jgi:predicted Co/Zn/Cd cation transporter (cation efflux family)
MQLNKGYLDVFKSLFSSEGMTEDEAKVWRSPTARVLQIAVAIVLAVLAIVIELFMLAFVIVAYAVMSVITLVLSPIALISYLLERGKRT